MKKLYANHDGFHIETPHCERDKCRFEGFILTPSELEARERKAFERGRAMEREGASSLDLYEQWKISDE